MLRNLPLILFAFLILAVVEQILSLHLYKLQKLLGLSGNTTKQEAKVYLLTPGLDVAVANRL